MRRGGRRCEAAKCDGRSVVRCESGDDLRRVGENVSVKTVRNESVGDERQREVQCGRKAG